MSGTGTESYVYDALNRLTQVTYPNSDIVGYTYDANGNRLTETVNSVQVATNTYDAADQLLSDGTTSYTYDDAGNLLTAGADSYTWDWASRLQSATIGGLPAIYVYDGDDVRTSAMSGGVTTPYTWDRLSGVELLVDDGANAYLHADGIQSETNTANTTTFHLTDGLGSVRGLTDANATLIGTADYSVFGEYRSQTGASSLLGFTGEQHNSLTGGVYLRSRYLDPGQGRFLSADTVQPNAPGSQGYNLYAYAANNPTTWTDPTGHAVGGGGSGTDSTRTYESPVLAENWLEIGLALADRLIDDCAARSPGGVCIGISAALIRTFTIIGCVLEIGGPCWGTQRVSIPNIEPGTGGGPIPDEQESGGSHDDRISRFFCDLLDSLGEFNEDRCRYVIPEGAKQWLMGEWGNRAVVLLGPVIFCSLCRWTWLRAFKLPTTKTFQTGSCLVCVASIAHLLAREGFLVYEECLA